MDEQKTNDKLTDKAFTRLMILSVLGILVCLACLCSATWAWFSGGVASDSNKLGAGSFDLTVSVLDATSSGTQTVAEATDKVVTLASSGEYTVTLTMTDDTTVTKGYCVLSINGVKYKTNSIRLDVSNPFVFTLKIDEPVTISFEPCWGLPAHSDVSNGGTLIIGANN